MPTLRDSFLSFSRFGAEPVEYFCKSPGHGEGSRGGHIIGHTKNGHAIYSGDHSGYHGIGRLVRPSQGKRHRLGNPKGMLILPSSKALNRVGKQTRANFPHLSLDDHEQAARMHALVAFDHQREKWKASRAGDHRAAAHHAQQGILSDHAQTGHQQAARRLAAQGFIPKHERNEDDGLDIRETWPTVAYNPRDRRIARLHEKNSAHNMQQVLAAYKDDSPDQHRASADWHRGRIKAGYDSNHEASESEILDNEYKHLRYHLAMEGAHRDAADHLETKGTRN